LNWDEIFKKSYFIFRKTAINAPIVESSWILCYINNVMILRVSERFFRSLFLME